MLFTNISGRGVYLTAAGREVRPMGTFSVPWLRGRTDRGLRAAMASGCLAWSSERDEPEVPGSPRIPKAARASAAEVRVPAGGSGREAAANAALSANMSRMGRFDVPQVKPRAAKSKSVSVERPVTKADVIRGGAPRSLADAQRHNRALRAGK